MVYLAGFVFYRPWRDQLTADPGASALAAAIVRRSGGDGSRKGFCLGLLLYQGSSTVKLSENC